MKRPTTQGDVDVFLGVVEELVAELDLRRVRLRDIATQLQMAYSDDCYLSFKAEFVVIVIMLRSMCLGCIDFQGPKYAQRAAHFEFEVDEGYSLRNALVLMNGRLHWQDMVDYLNREIEEGLTLLMVLKRFANSFVCHYDPKGVSFEELYRKITWSNGFFSRLEGVILKLTGIYSSAQYHYRHSS